MAKLTILAACEKVIVDRQGLPSLISIFQRINVPMQKEPFPENALVPFPWVIFALWQHTDDELNKDFIQHTEVITPDGKMFAKMQTKFKITEADDRQSKNHIVVNGIPVWAEGFITVNVWLEGFEDDKVDYKFFVTYLKQPSEDTGS
jgi:hypothetical protein